jgi:hypothetical protein
MQMVEAVRAGMKQGDCYEVVLRQQFQTNYSGPASELFARMQEANPSPYEFLLQFGDEQLVGASPEMFVRVEGARVETCPISGTARRTNDPLIDAENIRDLLNSRKEESELTMCTDVDRNDKSRVCEPGTVKVIGRKLIETYAGLFHTVDHVEGFLKEGFDSLDALLRRAHADGMAVRSACCRSMAISIPAFSFALLTCATASPLIPPARRCSMIRIRRRKSRKPASKPLDFSVFWTRRSNRSRAPNRTKRQPAA